MKKEIHPELHPVIFRDTAAGVDFFGVSTRSTEAKETVEGKEYSVIEIEVSSASHPFYTGEETIIDAAGRVEKFTKRAERKATKGKKQRKPIATSIKEKKEIDLTKTTSPQRKKKKEK